MDQRVPGLTAVTLVTPVHWVLDLVACWVPVWDLRKVVTLVTPVRMPMLVVLALAWVQVGTAAMPGPQRLRKASGRVKARLGMHRRVTVGPQMPCRRPITTHRATGVIMTPGLVTVVTGTAATHGAAILVMPLVVKPQSVACKLAAAWRVMAVMP